MKALAACALAAGVIAQAGLPPLPELALDTYPAAARASISLAHQNVRQRPEDAEAAAALGRTLQAWEQWDGAHLAYARCQALTARFDCEYLDGLVLQRLARHADAAVRFRMALKASPDDLTARAALADALVESGSTDDARQVLELLARDPRAMPIAEFQLGRLEAAAGRHDSAIRHFQRAIELYPEFGSAYYALALSFRAIGNTAEARQALAQHAVFGPRWPALDDPARAAVATLRDDGAATMRRGVALAEAGDVPGAIAAHEAALARDPTLVQAHVNLVSLYGREGNFAKGEEHYRAAVALGGDLGEAHYDYGVLLGLAEEWDAAANAYRRAIELNPSHAQAHNNLGQILERQQAYEPAAGEYRLAVEAQPTFRLARFNLGRMLLATGRSDEAVIELARLSQPQDRDTPRYLFALSAAHVRAGHKDEGIKWAAEARRLAIEYGQKDLVAIIDRDLARLK